MTRGMSKETFKEIVALSEVCGLHYRTYNPGDTVTRYRLFTSPDRDYFDSEDRVHTCLGTKELLTYLRGYRDGLQYHGGVR